MSWDDHHHQEYHRKDKNIPAKPQLWHHSVYGREDKRCQHTDKTAPHSSFITDYQACNKRSHTHHQHHQEEKRYLIDECSEVQPHERHTKDHPYSRHYSVEIVATTLLTVILATKKASSATNPKLVSQTSRRVKFLAN